MVNNNSAKMEDEKEQFKILFNMCMKAHAKANDHLNELATLLQRDAELINRLPTEPGIFLNQYDQAVERLSIVSDVLRKFNIQVELSDKLPNKTLVAAIGSKTVALIEAPSPQNGSGWRVVKPASVCIGYEGHAIISHVKDVGQQRFYITDYARIACNLVELTQYPLKGSGYEETLLPPHGCIFGILVNGAVFRAQQEIPLTTQSNICTAFLVDTGETIEIAKGACSWCHLPLHLRKVPPQAILCKLNKVHGFNGIGAHQFLREHKDSQINYKVVDKDCQVLVVDVYQREDVNLNIVKPQNHISPVHNPSDPIPKCGLQKTVDGEVTSATISSEQKPLITIKSTESVVIVDPNPQDERRLCKFYNAMTGACLMGPSCQLDHVSSGDISSLDQTVTKLNEMPQPDSGWHIKIIPTHVISPKMFYAQLTQNAPKMQEVNLRMHAPEYAAFYKPMSAMPRIMQLVLSRFSDGLMYRAQVLELFDDRVMVFYVDFGNCDLVELANLSPWDDRFDFVPFQAYRFCLDNDELGKGSESERMVEQFKLLVLHKELMAHVQYRLNDELYVRLVDRDGFDIGSVLRCMVPAPA